MMDGKSIRNKLIGSDDERAVSPVIGVILMVAITVILAAVIAAFVMDMGSGMGDDAAPNTATDVGTNSDWSDSSTSDQEAYYISHSSGDEIPMDNLELVIRNADGASVVSMDSDGWSGNDGDSNAWSASVNGQTADADINDEVFEGGSTITVSINQDSADNLEDEYEIQLIHGPSDSTVVSSAVDAP